MTLRLGSTFKQDIFAFISCGKKNAKKCWTSKTLLDKVKSADICESLNIEALLLRLERSQLRWYGHVTRMSQERTAKNCSVQHRLVEGLEAVPELDGEIT